MKTIFTLLLGCLSFFSVAAQSGILYFPDSYGIQAMSATADGNLVFFSEDRMTKCDYSGAVIWQTPALTEPLTGDELWASDDRDIFEMPDGSFIFFSRTGVFRISAIGEVLVSSTLPGIDDGHVIAACRDEHGFQVIGENTDLGASTLIHFGFDEDLNERFTFEHPIIDKYITSGIRTYDDKMAIGMTGQYMAWPGYRVMEQMIIDTLGNMIFHTEAMLDSYLYEYAEAGDRLFQLESVPAGSDYTLTALNEALTAEWTFDFTYSGEKDSLLFITDLTSGNIVMLKSWMEWDPVLEQNISTQAFEIFTPAGVHLSTSAEFLRSANMLFWPSDMIALSDDLLAISGSMLFNDIPPFVGCILFVDTAGVIEGVYLNGRVFSDTNGNEVFDPGEPVVPYPKISSDAFPSYVLGNEEGLYDIFVATPSDIHTEWVNEPYWDLCTPETYTYSITPPLFGTVIEDQDFRIDYTTPLADLGVSIVDAFGALPIDGSDTIYRYALITVNNFGTVTEDDGTLTVEIPEYFDDITLTPAGSILGTTVTWNIEDLEPFASKDFRIDYMLEFDTALVGSIYSIDAWVEPSTTDANYVNNACDYEDLYEYAFDPNNKEVYPVGDIPAFEVEYLQYTINFQNTGTAEAHNVYLIDTLDESLIPSSLMMLNTSHEVSLENLAENVYKWSFYDINLTPYLEDFEHSYGSITFRVGIDQSIPYGTLIENEAAIYFDLNPPVITNTTVNKWVQSESIENMQADDNFAIYPNPAADHVYVAFTTPVADGSTLQIYNLNKQLVQSISTTGDQLLSLPIQQLDPGMYFIHFQGQVKHFVKM